jgi:5-methylcytosine-specific restriction endonuclease McrA
LLLWGYKPRRLAVHYAFRHIDEQRIRWKNFKKWRIEAKSGSRRGPRCPGCRKRRPCLKGDFCHDCYYDSIRKGRRMGPDHPSWKGGISLTEELVRLSPEYERFRDEVLAGDRYECTRCHLSQLDGAVLQVDHIIPQAARPDLRLEPWNARTLCVECHKNTETYGAGAKMYVRLFRTGELKFWIE